MKPITLVAGALLAACLFGWWGSCTALRAERKLHRVAWDSWQDSLASWQPIRDSLTAEASRLARAYASARSRVPSSAETVRVMLARGADSTEGLAALGNILRAGAACDAAFTTCEARLALETRRGDRAVAMADTVRGWYQAEIRHSRAWKPFSLKPPGLPWLGGLVLVGMVLGR